MESKIIVIDDDPICIDSYKRILSGLEREIEFFQDPSEAVAKFSQNPFLYSLAFVDYQYKSNGEVKRLGVKVAGELKALNPMLTTCIVSGDESEEAIHSWLSATVDSYKYKPLRKTEILAFADHYVLDFESNFTPYKQEGVGSSQRKLLEEVGIIGESESLIHCVKNALRFAKSDLNVLLLGETGTGKELFAQTIHKNSKNDRFGLFPVNCSNYKEESQLLEVELFGSEKGAFTGAEKKVGILEAANGGTVFLDEIHQLSGAAQSKLLRVLQERKIRRVGGQREYPVKFRLIAACKSDIKSMCEDGKFSPDLYYRLKGLDLTIPPLRDRKRDIRPLVQFFLQQIEDRIGESKKISNRALEFLEKYDWPGNVRELQQLIEKLNVMTDDEVISPKHLPENICKTEALKGQIDTLTDLDKEYRNKQIALILNALNKTNYNFTEATRRLGLGEKRSTLRSRMKQLNIKDLDQNEKKGLLYQLAENFI